MRIELVQSGGLAGLRIERVVETRALPDAARDALEARVQEARFFELPARAILGMPDMIQYRVRVEDSDARHEIVFDDGTASETLRALIALILASGHSGRPQAP